MGGGGGGGGGVRESDFSHKKGAVGEIGGSCFKKREYYLFSY